MSYHDDMEKVGFTEEHVRTMMGEFIAHIQRLAYMVERDPSIANTTDYTVAYYRNMPVVKKILAFQKLTDPDDTRPFYVYHPEFTEYKGDNWDTAYKLMCPRCKELFSGFPALSRLDNITAICSPCGTDEAMQDFSGQPLTNFLEEEN